MLIVVFYVCVFFIGLSFGSFLNCLIYRLAKKQSLSGRSFCPHCKKQIAWYDNIPLISFVLLKGKCRHCQQKISWQYPLIELLMGTLFVLPLVGFFRSDVNFLVLGQKGFVLDILKILRTWSVYFILTFIFVYDLKYMMIEDSVLLSGAGLVLLLNLFAEPLANHLIDLSFWARSVQIFWTTLIGVGFFAVQYLLTKGKGIGLGDLRIGFFMAVALGHWSMICLALVISYFIGALVSLFLIVFKKKGLKSEIPLGPFLALGTFFVFIFGQEIINIIIRT
ncbi:MAG: prepilin peptidase [Patescibacteria group bacterium]|jgi:prepilin signal peptidase PulO-like enzyme (type II secretory pathway)|nr:prepilin peptidase [Patescibacteria group bacterium]MDD5173008.1 prepilin peptidase [Patescibacteria group bacterium]